MARIYTTRVAPAGGHGEGKSGSRYLLLELTTEEGTSGWGELSDIEPDWNIPDISVLQRFLEIRLKGREVLQRQRMSAELADEIPADWHRELRRMFALTVDTALLDLAGRIHRVPAYELLGGLYRDRLPISWVAFIRDPARSGLKEPLLVRDALKQFGPPPSGSVWFMDHPNASVVRLADGHWHHLLIYRILDRGEHSGGVAGSSDRALCRGGHLARPANPGVELCVKNDECAEAV